MQSAAAAASATQERTVLPRLCALPWKQSWILNRDARGRGREPTVCCPFGLTSCCPSPGSVVAALCPAGGRGAEAEGPCGAGGCGRGVRGGPERKGLRHTLGPGEQRTTSAEVVGAKGARGAGGKGKRPTAAAVGSTPRCWGPQCCRKGASLRGS